MSDSEPRTSHLRAPNRCLSLSEMLQSSWIKLGSSDQLDHQGCGKSPN